MRVNLQAWGAVGGDGAIAPSSTETKPSLAQQLLQWVAMLWAPAPSLAFILLLGCHWGHRVVQVVHHQVVE